MVPSRYSATSGAGLARAPLATTGRARGRRPPMPSATSRRSRSRPTSVWSVPLVLTTGALLPASGAASDIEASPVGAVAVLAGPARHQPMPIELGPRRLQGVDG